MELLSYNWQVKNVLLQDLGFSTEFIFNVRKATMAETQEVSRTCGQNKSAITAPIWIVLNEISRAHAVNTRRRQPHTDAVLIEQAKKFAVQIVTGPYKKLAWWLSHEAAEPFWKTLLSLLLVQTGRAFWIHKRQLDTVQVCVATEPEFIATLKVSEVYKLIKDMGFAGWLDGIRLIEEGCYGTSTFCNSWHLGQMQVKFDEAMQSHDQILPNDGLVAATRAAQALATVVERGTPNVVSRPVSRAGKVTKSVKVKKSRLPAARHVSKWLDAPAGTP